MSVTTPEMIRAEEVEPRLPPSIAVIRWIAIAYLKVFKRFSIVHAERLPLTGPTIVVANHAKAYDPVGIQVASPRRLVRFMQAREYYELPGVHSLLKLLQVIPLNRNGKDTAGIRTALRALSNGECLGIFPEGRISLDGDLQEARQGVALLALATKATVIPAYIHGTRPHAGMLHDFLEFGRVTLYFGEPVALGDLYGKHRDPETRQVAVNRIMGAIAGLRAANQRHSARPRTTENESATMTEGGK